jgi:hypothetical protein
LLLSDDERAVLERWTRRATSAQALALRARIVLACAGPEVPPIVAVARELRAGTAPEERHPLVSQIDGRAQWSVEVHGRPDLAAVPAQAASRDTFKLSTDPLFVEKVYDVVGLYFNPPEGAVVLSVDEKSRIHTLDRSQPVLPIMPGMPERRTDDYVRNGLTTLFAAFDVATGEVITALHRRHRAEEILDSLARFCRRISGAGH